ncbi:hypothetical protein [Tautonia marina]|uniref:hypothetical protein n=1 Tax=Tautonia marina TaxID=2653855 RepID=UPI0013763C7E|nr:hypothetical protein [Tautonia marina]
MPDRSMARADRAGPEKPPNPSSGATAQADHPWQCLPPHPVFCYNEKVLHSC